MKVKERRETKETKNVIMQGKRKKKKRCNWDKYLEEKDKKRETEIMREENKNSLIKCQNNKKIDGKVVICQKKIKWVK